MRVTSLPLLAMPLLFADCGAKQDLVIGELTSQAGTAGALAGSAGAEPAGGAVAAAGSGGAVAAGGSSAAGGTDAGGTAGKAGGTDDCIAGSEPPTGSLIHRYRFDDTGATAADAIAGADGNVVGTVLDGSGVVVMDSMSRQYVDLPNGIVSSLTDVTIVTWMTWSGEAAYQRVFDFGISDKGEGLGDSGRSYLAVLPKTGFDNQAKPGLGAELKAPGFPTIRLGTTEAMKNRAAQVSLVFKSGVSIALYLDGNRLASEATAITLADIDDRNNWIGQSQYMTDPVYEGSYEEFRIYDAALDSCQLHSLLVRGPQSP